MTAVKAESYLFWRRFVFIFAGTSFISLSIFALFYFYIKTLTIIYVRLWLGGLCLFFFLSSAVLHAQPLAITSLDKPIPLRSAMLHLSDVDGKMSLADAVAAFQHRKAVAVVPSKLKEGIQWFYVQIANPTAQTQLLVYHTGMRASGRGDLFVLSHLPSSADTGPVPVVAQQRAGRLVNQRELPLADVQMVFTLSLPGNSERHIFFRLKTPGTYIRPFKPELMSYQDYSHISSREKTIRLMFFGALLALFLYNFFVAIITREGANIFFCILVATAIPYQMYLDGSIQALWPDDIWPEGKTRLYWPVQGLFFATYCFFSYIYLDLSKAAMWMRYTQKALVGAFLLHMFSNLWATITVSILLSFALMGLMAVNNLCTSFILWRRGSQAAKIYFIALSGYFFCIFLYINLTQLGIDPDWGWELARRVAFIAPMFMFAIGLAYRFNELTQQSLLQQQRAMQAETKARVKGEFLATMSHEIRTPMNAILGMSELLRDEALTGKQRHYNDIVVNAGHSLLNIINDILDISKMESGLMRLESIEVDLRAVASAVS